MEIPFLTKDKSSHIVYWGDIVLYFFIITFVFVFIIGVSDIIHSFKLKLFNTVGIKSNILVCYLNDISAELNLRYVIEQRNWYGQSFAGQIIAINNINSIGVLLECQKIAQNYDVKILTPEEFSHMIKNGDIDG